MSVQATTWAWLQPTGSSTEKLVVVNLGDRANADGYCFPGLVTIARDTELDERSVRRALKKLADAGLITIGKKGRRNANAYQLHLDRGVQVEPKPDTESGLDQSIPDTESGLNRTQSPDIPDTESAEPSLNHQKNLRQSVEGHSGQNSGKNSKPPTEDQLAYILSLSGKLGIVVQTPRTKSEATKCLDALKASLDPNIPAMPLDQWRALPDEATKRDRLKADWSKLEDWQRTSRMEELNTQPGDQRHMVYAINGGRPAANAKYDWASAHGAPKRVDLTKPDKFGRTLTLDEPDAWRELSPKDRARFRKEWRKRLGICNKCGDQEATDRYRTCGQCRERASVDGARRRAHGVY